MSKSEKNYTIKSGDKNGFYCLYLECWDIGFNGKIFYWQHQKNLSTDKEKAIKKARDYIGISDYDFDVNFNLDDWGTNDKEEKFNGNHNDNAHVISYYENKEFIKSVDFSFNDDKQTFTGKIILTYWKENPINEYYPEINKMWFLDDRGFVLNLTVPKKLDDNILSTYNDGEVLHNFLENKHYKGVRFSFDAILNQDTYTQDFTLEHENCSQDLKCAFVKRPTKIKMEN
jgi:hypothetical protein